MAASQNCIKHVDMRLRIKSTIIFRILISVVSDYTLGTEKKLHKQKTSEFFGVFQSNANHFDDFQNPNFYLPGIVCLYTLLKIHILPTRLNKIP